MTAWVTVAVLALVAIALAGTLYLFLVLKRDMWATTRKHEKQYAELLDARRQLEAEVEGIRAGFLELQAHTGMLVAPAPPPSGLNISKRSQAIRMLRRGDRAEQVADALNLPRSEVALLAKIERIAAAVAQSEPRPTVHS